MTKKRVWTFFAVIASVAAAVCLILLLNDVFRAQPPAPSLDPTPDIQSSPDVSPEPTPETEPDSAVQTVEIPVDFESLQQEHPDIYAWIQMPETAIDYPVVQRFGDAEYYLRRNLDGKYSVAGTIFSEFTYNGIDFADPVTLIYGHNMNDDSMFGQLQTFVESQILDETSVFYIYQPERRLTYQIFAGVPYSNSHVLHYHNFHMENEYNRFFDEIYASRSLHANLNAEARPQFGERVVILSTCLNGDRTQRYLVMGVLIEDTAQPLS